LEYNDFWIAMEALIAQNSIVINRPKGSVVYDSVRCPCDYGYLTGAGASGGSEDIDLWQGSKPVCTLDGVVVGLDMQKRDAEVKLLLGCTEDEMQEIYSFQNWGDRYGLLVLREDA
jgi:inorganic pyrophosphatase